MSRCSWSVSAQRVSMRWSMCLRAEHQDANLLRRGAPPRKVENGDGGPVSSAWSFMGLRSTLGQSLSPGERSATRFGTQRRAGRLGRPCLLTRPRCRRPGTKPSPGTCAPCARGRGGHRGHRRMPVSTRCVRRIGGWAAAQGRRRGDPATARSRAGCRRGQGLVASWRVYSVMACSLAQWTCCVKRGNASARPSFHDPLQRLGEAVPPRLSPLGCR